MKKNISIKEIWGKTCEELRHMWESPKSDRMMVYPEYRNGKEKGKRFSEQEARFIFAILLNKADIPFAVEVPTEKKFKFGKEIEKIEKCEGFGGRSASYDLVAYLKDNGPVYVEFKAHNATTHSIAKDIFKLAMCSGERKIFYHVLKNASLDTFKKLSDKYVEASKRVKKEKGDVKGIKIVVSVIGNLTGKPGKCWDKINENSNIFEYKWNKSI